MNTLILNRDTFQMPEDGWYQIAPLGEFPHEAAGVLQVVDRAACVSMANAFRAESQKPNFAGLLIDFDHFSLDGKQKSEAAGWVTALENRDDGLWGKIRWSDTGEDCVRGGRYRFLSPVWARSDCEDLGADPQSGRDRLRPVRLLNAAVTNDPNIKGMVPLSNRKIEDGAILTTEGTENAERNGGDLTTKDAKREIANSSAAPRFKWVLGDHDRNCPSCGRLSGQVHTMEQWDAAGLRPKSDRLLCGGHCHCSLVETDEELSGSLSGLPVRKEEVVNRESVVANNWSDAARAASIAVRRAKAAARKLARRGQEQKDAVVGDGVERRETDPPDESERIGIEHGVEPPVVRERPRRDEGDVRILPITAEEEDFDRTLQAIEDYRSDANAAFQREFGYRPVDPEDVQWAEEMAGVPDEFRTGGVMSARELAQKMTHYGEEVSSNKYRDGADEGHLALERESQDGFERRTQERQGNVEAIDDMAKSLMTREAAGEALSTQEKAFLKQYREIIGDLGDVMRDVAGNRATAEDVRLAVARDKALLRNARRIG